MTYRPTGNKILYNEYQATLGSGLELDTDWLDLDTVDKVAFYAVSSHSGMTYIQQFRDNAADTNAVYIPIPQNEEKFQQFVSSPGTRQARYRWKNTTDATVSGVSLTIKGSYGGSDKAQVFALNQTIRTTQQAQLNQSIQRGKQPDGDYVAQPADGSAFNTNTPLLSGEEYTSAWYDTDGWNCIELFVSSDVQSSGQGIIVEYSDDIQASPSPTIRATLELEFNQTHVNHGYAIFNIPPALDGFRLRYVNNSHDQTEFYMDATLKVNRDTTNYNEGGAQIVGDFLTEVALGVVPGYAVGTKFGRNPEIDTGTTPEDVWIGGGIYPGFNPAIDGGEKIAVYGGATDTGTLVSTGTSTGASSNYIDDSTADFVGDGVAVGDLLINDSRASHGIITAVAATRLTVFSMIGLQNGAGDTYRVATTNGVGAAVVKVKKMLKNNFIGEYSEYIIMNGATPVSTVGDTYIRCSRASVILAGSIGTNVGIIVGGQATTTANVFFNIGSGDGQTLQCVWTVPAGQTQLGKRIRMAITRLAGTAGSATVYIEQRPYGEAWKVIRAFEISTGASVLMEELGGVILRSGTDMRVRVKDVSDNDTVIDASLAYMIKEDANH